MRATLIVFAVLLLALAGYAYFRDPSGCEKVLNDALSVVTSLSPVSLNSGGASPISPLIQGKLISADGSPFNFPASAPVTSIRYYAIYYSAQWCPPCHAFTPVLVEWYKKFKAAHSNFELIFVSDDHDKASMLAYMKEMAMPWPAFSFEDTNHDGKGIEKFAGSGIPDLVLVDADGKVLSDSFSGSSYLGPRHVLDDIEKLVGPGTPTKPVQATAPAAASVSAVSPPPPSLPTAVPVPAASPAPAAPAIAVVSAPAANPSLDTTKPWVPPDVMPAQPNWTWTALDGKTYQDVVVTKIEADTVTITHSMGVAHIPINLLPPDIQRQLNYDPHAVSPLPASSVGH
jgi:nucleoredoxin